MGHWWEIAIPGQPGQPPKPRAVAYYRHSAQDRQENSIPIQQEQVREWAEKNGVEIIHEFADAGKSGLNAEGRPAFTEMMEEWVKKRHRLRLHPLPGRKPLGPLSRHRFVCPILRRVPQARQAGHLHDDRQAEGGRPALPRLRAVRAVPGRPVQPGTVGQGVAWRSPHRRSRATGRAAPRRTARGGSCWTRNASRSRCWNRANARASRTSG